MKRYLLGVVLIIISSCCSEPFLCDESCKIETAGIENFYQVSSSLYRSAAPDSIGLKNIADLGIRTVIDLRMFPHRTIENESLEQIQIPMLIWPMEKSDIIRIIHTVTSPEKCPVLIHCLRGSDRTGAMVAIYRIVVLDWSKEKAIHEMRCGGFGYQRWLISLTSWIWNLDVEEIRHSAGLVKTADGYVRGNYLTVEAK